MMRKKNRKKNRKGGFLFPVPLAGIIALVCGLGLAYVWLGCGCESLGRELKDLEGQRAVALKKYRNEECRWAWMKSPRNMERSLSRHGLAMTWPRRDQVVRLYDPGDADLAMDGDPGDALRIARLERTYMNE